MMDASLYYKGDLSAGLEGLGAQGLHLIWVSSLQKNNGQRFSSETLLSQSRLYSWDTPTCLDRQLAQPLSCAAGRLSQPLPPQPSTQVSAGGAKQRAASDSHSSILREGGISESSAVFECSVPPAKVVGDRYSIGSMLHPPKVYPPRQAINNVFFWTETRQRGSCYGTFYFISIKTFFLLSPSCRHLLMILEADPAIFSPDKKSSNYG